MPKQINEESPSSTIQNSIQDTQKAFLKGKLQTPYLVDDSSYHRFSERMYAFSRVMWDKTFKSYGRKVRDRVPEILAQNKPGYSHVDFAAQDAAWTV